MSRTTVEQLLDRWMNDPAFREETRRDPEGTVRSIGLPLDVDEWAALRNFDWSLPDDELEPRASKWGELLGASCTPPEVRYHGKVGCDQRHDGVSLLRHS